MTITDERRLVTVLFADLVGFTGRAEQSDPEAVREFQRAYFAAVAAEVERFGGIVESTSAMQPWRSSEPRRPTMTTRSEPCGPR
ncbi:MAG: hypothetical protein LC798_08705 [Chloroflexi bacterium]|nr:hypothetical protein [Chloroflexota bacterium]